MITFIPNLRQRDVADNAVQAYVDTPAFVYSDWLTDAENNGDKIGTLSAKVGVIGDGPAGSAAAFELQKSGANVTLFTSSTDHYGGRTYSDFFINKDGSKSKDIAELGAMRFPPSEETLFYYFKKFDISTSDTFPDPGKLPTWLSYKGEGQLWSNANTAPKGFENVHAGFVDLATNGIFNGENRFASSVEMSNLLKNSSTNGNDLNTVTEIWKRYITEFGADSFYTGLNKIFGPNRTLSVYSNVTWNAEDFTKFGALGIGSGGFGPLYSIGFLYIYRILINQLETGQLFVPGGISQLCDKLLDAFQAAGGSIIKNRVVKIDTISNNSDSDKLTLHFKGQDREVFDYVIVATTTRAMELGLDISSAPLGTQSNHRIVTPDVAEAINRTHVISSSKFFIRTKKFWEGGKFPRNILSDTKMPQLYTLDYGEAESGVVLAQYTWEDDSIKMLAFTSPEEYLELIKDIVNKITAGSKYADFAQNLAPYTGDINRDTRLINWESKPDYYGAFTLAHPGQDAYVDTMFRDFGKSKSKRSGIDSGVYIAGDCVSWSGGWIEGALHSGLNAAAAVIQSSNGTFTDAEVNPITRVAPKRYTYFR